MDLNANYEIITFSIGDTKAGTKMGKMQIRNLSDNSTLNCVLWEEAINRIDEKKFRTGNIIKLKSATFNEKFNNCNVVSFDLVEEAKLGVPEDVRDKMFADLISEIEKFKDEKIRDFVKGLLVQNADLFKIMPAAKAMHHNYLGGLLVHTTECYEFAKMLYPKLKNINEDELYAACILHDLGKIYEYSINTETGAIEYNDKFKKDWITHSQYGFTICMSNGFDRIAKMIASHHGRADWGALIDLNEKDLEPFYYIVHHIDDLSAKFGKISVKDI